MTFKHKLAHRLALLRDRSVAVAGRRCSCCYGSRAAKDPLRQRAESVSRTTLRSPKIVTFAGKSGAGLHGRRLHDVFLFQCYDNADYIVPITHTQSRYQHNVPT